MSPNPRLLTQKSTAFYVAPTMRLKWYNETNIKMDLLDIIQELRAAANSGKEVFSRSQCPCFLSF